MLRTAVAATVATVAALALTVGGLAVDAVAAPPVDPDGPVISPAQALARGTGVSVAAAQRTLEREAVQTAAAQRLTSGLGEQRSAGAWIDTSGTLTVAVTDQVGAASVRQAGARPVTVTRSQQRLRAVAARLEAAARAGRLDDVTSWGIDPTTNSVRLQTAALRRGGVAARLVDEVAGAITVETSPARLMTTAQGLVGGREFTGLDTASGERFSCSTGFSARDRAGNQRMVTAGHCLVGASGFRSGELSLGVVLGSSFPGDDHGALKIYSQWRPVPRVTLYNGQQTDVKGATVAAIGATLCKSGRTTRWTCGKIVSYDNTVNYGNGEIVSGLTQHSACVEQGDSGGANLSNGQAQGVTSGGQLYPGGSGYVCGDKVGRANVAFFQPVREILGTYQLSLLTA